MSPGEHSAKLDAEGVGVGEQPNGPAPGTPAKIVVDLVKRLVTRAGQEVKLFLTLPDLSRVVDARVFADTGVPDRTGSSDARYPDGGSEWVYSSSPTRGSSNTYVVEMDLVINEIMYDPPWQAEGTEFVELFNRGTRPVDVSGWRFSEGISSTQGAHHVAQKFKTTTLPR